MAPGEMIMSKKRYTEEFKIEAVRQVTERGYSVAEVAGIGLRPGRCRSETETTLRQWIELHLGRTR